MMAVTASPPHQPSVQCTCVNAVLPDIWPGADAPPCSSRDSNLFEQLYMLSHVLLSENDATPKSLSGTQPAAKNPITDIESYPVRVRSLLPFYEDHSSEPRQPHTSHPDRGVHRRCERLDRPTSVHSLFLRFRVGAMEQEVHSVADPASCCVSFRALPVQRVVWESFTPFTVAGLHPLVVANKQHFVLTGSAIRLSFLTHIEHFHPTAVGLSLRWSPCSCPRLHPRRTPSRSKSCLIRSTF